MVRRHRSPGTPAASDPSDSSTNSGSFKCLAEDGFFSNYSLYADEQ